jgi:tRNA-uridine 2-sulfurtransferase
MTKKAVIALSGGVDSAISAYFLKQQGYEVTAIFMQNWDDYLNSNKNQLSICSQTEDWKDAQKVADKLAIPLIKINFIQEYWNEVFASFLDDLKKGLTPNPDVLCNKKIKFNRLIKYVEENFSSDYFLATGHYAKMDYDAEKNQHYLKIPLDKAKDQTYFLCQINPTIFNKLLFPLADFTKQQVREIAEKLRLDNAKKKDSTGICFIGEQNFNLFLSAYLEEREGKVVDIDNQQIKGKHQGLHYFTIGQRKGIGISGQPNPYYVVGKDVNKNLIYIAKGWNNPWLYSKYCLVKNINYLIDKKELSKLFTQQKITAKFRYRQSATKVKIFCSVEGKVDEIKVEFENPQRSITPGQYAVMYLDDVCLGGGIIHSTDKIDYNSKPIGIFNQCERE